MDEIRLIGLSEADIDLIINIKGFEGFKFLIFKSFEDSLTQSISSEANYSFVIFESIESDYQAFWQQTRLQCNAVQKLNFCYLFSYGQLDTAKNLYHNGKINLYIQRPYSQFLLVSSLLALYYEKGPLSHVIEEVLELSLDDGCDAISEYMAQYRRKLLTNY
ncbi:MAG: hypothetical protein KC646_02900 [Candidatus Cloacimonetes bacterium]|nr:hypothetical protein [Candidatus Cloacimonadota bacterium]